MGVGDFFINIKKVNFLILSVKTKRRKLFKGVNIKLYHNFIII